MKRGVILFLCLATFAVAAQTISYWWEGMLRKPDAIQSQAYWIWPGSNIVFTYASNRFIINSTGGGGAVTNVGTNCFTFTAVAPVQVTTSGTPCINVQYAITGNLLGWNAILTNGYISGVTATQSFQAACANLTSWCGIPTNGFIDGPTATNAFQPACANLTAWCGIPTNAYVNGITVTNALNVYSNGILAVATNAFAPAGTTGAPQTNISYVAVTNAPWFGTNGSVQAMSNAFLMGGDGRLVLGTNNKTASAVNYSVFGTAVPSKLTVYGDISIANEVSNTVFMYTQRTNFLQASANADNGSLVLTNNSAGSWPAAMAIVNKSSKQTGAAIKNPAAFYSFGADSADNGTHDFFIYDQGAAQFVLASDSSQRMGVKLRLPNFQLDVAGDINTTNGQFRMNGQPLTNIVWTNTFLPASNLVVNLSNNVLTIVTNYVTNYVQGTVSNGVYGTGWHTNGNTIGTTKAFIGTLDNEGFEIRVNNTTAVVVTNGGLAVGVSVTNNASQANAFGQNTSASGANSFAAGIRAKSQNQGSFASGQDVISSGNGSFASGRFSVSSGDYSFSSGFQNTASGEGSFSGGEGSTAAGIGSFAFGTSATANNDGSFVWSDSNGSGFTDSAVNQFVVGADGGIFLHPVSSGFWIDGFEGITTNFIAITGPSTFQRFQFYKGIITNAAPVLYTNIFACLALTNAGQHLLLPAASTYQTVTNWHYVASNSITANPLLGHLTNAVAGYYRCTFSVSATPGNSDQIEADFATNGVPSDIIAAHGGTANPARDINLSSQGIVYLPANTTVSLMIQNVNSATLTVHHAQLTLGTP